MYRMGSMTNIKTRTRVEHWLRITVGLLALMPVLLFLASALRRLHYPYDLEELEGYMVYSLQRVMGGQTLYPAPNVHFMPYMYPPGYFYAASWVARIFHTGASFQTLRITSILSTLGGLLVLAAFVWRETRRFLPALIAAGLYAGCYRASGSWFDLGRVDSLYILLLLLALYATRFWPAPVAALFWLVTFTTKQSILPVAIVALCFHFERRLRTVAGLAVLGIGAGAILTIANRITSGWFSFYVFKVPAAGSHFIPRSAVLYLPLDLFVPMGIACLIILTAFLLVRPDWRQPHIRFYLLTLLFVPFCGYIRVHTGATTNTEMPLYAVIALLGGLSFAWLDRWIQDQWLQTPELQPIAVHTRWLGTVILLGAAAVQLSTGLYGPGDYVPIAEARRSLDAVMQETKQMPGDVFIPTQPFYAVMAGKTGYADHVSLYWVLSALDPVSRARLQRQFADILADPKVSAVFLDSTSFVTTYDELLNISPQWTDRFPVKSYAPGVDPITRPAVLYSLCPLPVSDYHTISPPIAPQACPVELP